MPISLIRPQISLNSMILFIVEIFIEHNVRVKWLVVKPPKLKQCDLTPKPNRKYQTLRIRLKRFVMGF